MTCGHEIEYAGHGEEIAGNKETETHSTGDFFSNITVQQQILQEAFVKEKSMED